MSTAKNNQQVKTRQRVVEHGEVFTHEREVKAMLDLVKDQTYRIDSTFLEPACGSGNFLIEILNRKLEVLKQKYSKSRIKYETNLIKVASTLYGVELLEDNTLECRERLLKGIQNTYLSLVLQLKSHIANHNYRLGINHNY